VAVNAARTLNKKRPSPLQLTMGCPRRSRSSPPKLVAIEAVLCSLIVFSNSLAN
jgi:hypothetical protein